MIRVVTGPPCSGKTTHVRKHAGPLDVVIDLDAIAHALGYPAEHIDWGETSHPASPRAKTPRANTPPSTPPGSNTPHPSRVAAMRARASLVKAALDNGFGAPCVWIVDAQLSPVAATRYLNAGAEIVRLDPGADVCHQRATDNGRPAATHEQIDRWYGDLGTTSTDW